MQKLDCYEVYNEIEKHAKNGGIIYTVLNDNYTPSAFIYDYVLYNRKTKSATIYKYIVRSGRKYSQRHYKRLPQSWENKIYVGDSAYGDKTQDYILTDYKELYGDLCE